MLSLLTVITIAASGLVTSVFAMYVGMDSSDVRLLTVLCFCTCIVFCLGVCVFVLFFVLFFFF